MGRERIKRARGGEGLRRSFVLGGGAILAVGEGICSASAHRCIRARSEIDGLDSVDWFGGAEKGEGFSSSRIKIRFFIYLYIYIYYIELYFKICAIVKLKLHINSFNSLFLKQLDSFNHKKYVDR